MLHIIRAHSFPREKFDKFSGEFGEFRRSPREGRWNFAVHCGYTVKFPRLD